MKSLHKALLAAAFAASGLANGAAHAADITGLFNTGVDNGGAVLAEGAADSHWVLNGGASAPVVYDNPAYTVPSDARFIAAAADGSYTLNPNTYTLTFDLGSLSASTAQLSGLFEADNYASVYLNGHLLAQDNQTTDENNFKSFASFSATGADFVSGQNVLSFVVTDTGPPSAFAVSQLAGTASVSAAPEPAAWALMIGGFGLAGASLRRRRSVAAAA